MEFQPQLRSCSMLQSISFCFISAGNSGHWDEELHGITAKMLPGAAKAIRSSAGRRCDAVKVFICNVMTLPGRRAATRYLVREDILYKIREDILYKMQYKCSVLAVRPFMLHGMQYIGGKTGEDDDLTGLCCTKCNILRTVPFSLGICCILCNICWLRSVPNRCSSKKFLFNIEAEGSLPLRNFIRKSPSGPQQPFPVCCCRRGQHTTCPFVHSR